MKIYLVKHKDTANRLYNLEAYCDIEKMEDGFYVKSVQAFLKKKHAQEYIDSLDETVRKYREIIAMEIL